MNLNPYPEYVESSVDWIGEIPKSWKTFRLKNLININSGESIPIDEIIPDGKYEVYGGNGHLGFADKHNTRDKTLIIGRVGAKCGNIRLVNREKWVSDNALIVKTNQNYEFMSYLLDDINLNRIASQNAQPLITSTLIKNQKVMIPKKFEQQIIVSFLDKKTSEIDLTIEKDIRLIELLKEKRTALINHVVTKGLDPTVKMKDSGVEWIGEIPEDWEVKKLKHASLISSDKLNKKPKELPYIGLEHIQSGNGVLLENNAEEVDSSVSRYKKGDILFGKLRPYLAKVIEAPFDGVGTTELVVIRMNESINSHFAFYQLLSDRFINLVNALTYGVKMPRANPDQIANISICIPPIKEQKEISLFLDIETSEIDDIIQKIQEKINLLEEYKKSLIHHVVTGKVDVREVAV